MPGSGEYIGMAVDEILSSKTTWNTFGILGVLVGSISFFLHELSMYFHQDSIWKKNILRMYSACLVPTKDLVFVTYDVGCLVLSLFLFGYLNLLPADEKSMSTNFIFGVFFTQFSYIIFLVGIMGVFILRLPFIARTNRFWSKEFIPLRLLIASSIVMFIAFIGWTY